MIKRLRAQSINTNSNTQANSPQLNDISHKKATTEVTSTSKCENKMTISDANEPRPALKLLNILNEKIEEEKKAYPLLQEISRLKEEN